MFPPPVSWAKVGKTLRRGMTSLFRLRPVWYIKRSYQGSIGSFTRRFREDSQGMMGRIFGRCAVLLLYIKRSPSAILSAGTRRDFRSR